MLSYQQTKLALFALLFFILLTAIYFRFKGVDYGFPLLLHSDEPAIAERALKIARTGDLDPDFFKYPTGYIYFQAIVYSSVFLAGKLIGNYDAFSEVPVLNFYYWGRVTTVVIAAVSLWVVFLIGRKLVNIWAGLFALAITAFSVLHVKGSFFIAVDIPMTLWVVVALYFSVLIFKGNKTLRNYILAAIAVGLAASSKYNGSICFVSIVAAHFFSRCNTSPPNRNVYILIAGIVSLVSFVTTTPYAVLNYNHFLKDLFFEFQHYSKGHIGFDNSGTSYLNYGKDILNGLGILVFSLSLISSAYLMLRRKYRELLFILVFPIIYFILLGKFKVHFERNIIPLVPHLSILASVLPAYLVAHLVKNLKELQTTNTSNIGLIGRLGIMLRSHTSLTVSSTITIIILFSGISLQGIKTKDYLDNLLLPDTRLLSTLWINENLPEGSIIAMDYYTPRPDERRFTVEMWGICGLGKAPRNYKGYDYIITSSIDYNRYFRNKEKYNIEYARYKDIFDKNILIKEFTPEVSIKTGPRISIYEVGK
ncbi:MAG: glycosyltransferase family 39 protein [Myxococcota bacterium]|nr:glycosyltransferase family 39 protein [Myxococcota bacterium]